MQHILAKNVELGDEVGRPEFEFLMQYITSGKKIIIIIYGPPTRKHLWQVVHGNFEGHP